MKNKLSTKKGFALVYAIIVSVIILIVITSVISIGLRQLELNAVTKESQNAFYASNSGIECALYWDGHTVDSEEKVFPFKGKLRGVDIDQDPISTNSDRVTCGERSIITESIDGNGFWGWSSKKNTYTFSIMTDGGVCANVEVRKEVIGDILQTIVTSRGYSSCDINIKNTVERGLVIIYES